MTTTRMEQRASEAPASVTVIDRTDIKESASQTIDDLTTDGVVSTGAPFLAHGGIRLSF